MPIYDCYYVLRAKEYDYNYWNTYQKYEYTLKNGETFSFNKLVGPCTAEEGYLEAEIFVNKQIAV